MQKAIYITNTPQKYGLQDWALVWKEGIGQHFQFSAWIIRLCLSLSTLCTQLLTPVLGFGNLRRRGSPCQVPQGTHGGKGKCLPPALPGIDTSCTSSHFAPLCRICPSSQQMGGGAQGFLWTAPDNERRDQCWASPVVLSYITLPSSTCLQPEAEPPQPVHPEAATLPNSTKRGTAAWPERLLPSSWHTLHVDPRSLSPRN